MTQPRHKHPSSEAAPLLKQAEDALNKGDLAAADMLCAKILLNEPQQPHALLIRSAVLVRQGRMEDAEKILAEGCRIYTDSTGFHTNLGRLYLNTNRHRQAIAPLQRAVILSPDNPDIKTSLLLAYHAVTDIPYSDEAKQAMILCLRDPMQRHEYMTQAWLALLHKMPEGLDDIVHDDFFLYGMQRLLISDPAVEQFLTVRRKQILEQYAQGILPKTDLPFLSILSRYCHFTEYAFNVYPAEKTLLQNLAPDSPAAIALHGCYRPLSDHPDAEKFITMANESDNTLFQDLIRIQVTEPLEERKIKQDIPILGTIENDISRAVQNQYEENPYPRWATLGVRPIPEQIKELAHGREILIAGCGTGREAAEAAMLFPYARITAVDLSRSSIAYGIRRSRELGIENIDFMQADILEINKIGRTFDLIISSGVLLCMEKPIEGWRQLVQVMRPDGQMKIALYSTIARDFIREARAFIQQEGYEGTSDGMRAFRARIMAMPDDNMLKTTLTGIKDFYSLSQCRDLVFHVNEHTFTLPQIDGLLADLGLSLLRMNVRRPEYIAQYQTMFPDDPAATNLANWHAFEKKNPYAFASMYQMWLGHKKSTQSIDSAWVHAVLHG